MMPDRKQPKAATTEQEKHEAAREYLAALPSRHAAVTGSRTLFPSTVVDAEESPRLLVSGHNSPKIGKRIIKGAWRGMTVWTLTLEERATCPRSCGVWRECMGNGMPFARRHRVSAGFFDLLAVEIDFKAERYPDGFVVRLHVLGDFLSLEYVAFWARMMQDVRPLHVYGYTAHGRETPIGDAIARLNARYRDRWAIRFSVEPDEACMVDLPMQATTIWRTPEGWVVPEGIVCPMQLGATDCCGTCGLCWAPAAEMKCIVFIGHGNVSGSRSRKREGKPDAG